MKRRGLPASSVAFATGLAAPALAHCQRQRKTRSRTKPGAVSRVLSGPTGIGCFKTNIVVDFAPRLAFVCGKAGFFKNRGTPGNGR